MARGDPLKIIEKDSILEERCACQRTFFKKSTPDTIYLVEKPYKYSTYYMKQEQRYNSMSMTYRNNEIKQYIKNNIPMITNNVMIQKISSCNW